MRGRVSIYIHQAIIVAGEKLEEIRNLPRHSLEYRYKIAIVIIAIPYCYDSVRPFRLLLFYHHSPSGALS